MISPPPPTKPPDCLSDEVILTFVQGAASVPEIAIIDHHLHDCARCRDVVAETARLLLSDGAERGVATGDEGRPAIARYFLESALGAGAGGVVYAAWDPQLKRRVALKLVLGGAAGGPGALTRERLLREAEIMARLSHPHVVPVHDAGVSGDHVFIVMELVEGETLARWLRSAPRTTREIMGVFAQCGRGLQAAHDMGVVHRDFKPENVLVGRDGRARVTDFGLARQPPEPAEAHGSPPAERATGDDLPVTGFAGTPLYMAPEQRAHGVTSPFTDQFSFCVALYMALYGRHPFGLRPAGDQARPLPPPGDASVSPALGAIVARGLLPEPAARHPSMAALVAALEDATAAPPPRSRRWWGPAVLALVALAAGARSFRAQAPAGRRCGDGVVWEGVEACDDGNQRDDDGCTRACVRCPPPGWAWSANGHCYRRHDDAATFAGARRTCEDEGGALVSYTGTYEARALWRALFEGRIPAEGSWIGWIDPKQSGIFSWSTGEPMYVPIPWAPGEPSAGCALERPLDRLAVPPDQHGSAVWALAPCDQHRPYVCEHAPWRLRPTDNHAYKLFAKLATWQQAKQACEARGAHLVTLGDADEDAFVRALSGTVTWIGATDQGQEGRYRWITGEVWRYTAFAPGDPEGFADHDCLALGPGGWHDRYCKDLYPFICEAE